MNTNKSWQEICLSRDKIKLQNKMIEKDCWQCCKNCLYWNGQCKQFNAIPPMQVLIVGCENWEYDIPF